MQTAIMPMKRVWPDTSPVDLSIVASGSAGLTMPELAAMRKEPLSSFPTVLSPQLLRHSDEQTLSALVAVSKAMQRGDVAQWDFSNWAIVSSSRNLGRSAFAAVIERYRTEGPWGVSVQVIPHCTTHSIAGTISLALASHGPCIGAGSGSAGEVDALVSVASILRQKDWCGAWIVFSGWSPELAIDPTGQPTSDSICLAAAIAVTRQPSANALGRIRINVPAQSTATLVEESYGTLTDFLAGARGDHRSWSSPASSAVCVDVEFTRGIRCGHLDSPLACDCGLSEQETN
jgi:hypothetical protein